MNCQECQPEGATVEQCMADLGWHHCNLNDGSDR